MVENYIEIKQGLFRQITEIINNSIFKLYIKSAGSVLSGTVVTPGLLIF
jgi:hypothetical protein